MRIFAAGGPGFGSEDLLSTASSPPVIDGAFKPPDIIASVADTEVLLFDIGLSLTSSS